MNLPIVSSPQACLVPTGETVRVCYFLERLLERRRPVMLVGTAGVGKSVLVGTKLASLDAEEYLVQNVPFNYYTTSAMLQGEGRSAWRVVWGRLSGHVPPTRSRGKASGTCWGSPVTPPPVSYIPPGPGVEHREVSAPCLSEQLGTPR